MLTGTIGELRPDAVPDRRRTDQAPTGDDPRAGPLGVLAQCLHEVSAHQRRAERGVIRPPSARHLAQELAGAGPHPLIGDGEAGLSDRFQTAQRVQAPQAIGSQAQERAHLSGRVGVRLVDGDLGTDPAQCDGARGPGHSAAYDDDVHTRS